MDIPDINVWLALVDENHVNHASAVRYGQETGDSPIAFVRVTMSGFLRLSTRPGVLSRPLASGEAWKVYGEFLALPNLRLLAEPEALDDHFRSLTEKTGLPHHLWTDAYLAAFAIAGGHRMVSFDAYFARFPGLDFLHLGA